MQKKNFFQVFKMNPDGSLAPKRVIEVNGATFGTGVSFGRGVSFGGVKFHDFMPFDLAVQEMAGKWVIKGFYNNA